MKICKQMLLMLLVLSATNVAHAADLMQGKQRTARTIRLEAIVNASPSEVYRRWTTEEGVKNFLAPAAHIDARSGGEYTIVFVPDKDPQGLSHGTSGARVLRAEPGKRLWFEWITFASDASLGANGPPIVPVAMRNTPPLPTWVEIELEPANAQGTTTLVKFAHYGFPQKGFPQRSVPHKKWDEALRWFTIQWRGVLDRLQQSFTHAAERCGCRDRVVIA